MALTPCPECGHMISTSNKILRCPNCGWVEGCGGCMHWDYDYQSCGLSNHPDHMCPDYAEYDD